MCVNTADVPTSACLPLLHLFLCVFKCGQGLKLAFVLALRSTRLIIQDLGKKRENKRAEDCHLIPFPLALSIIPACRVLFLGHEVEYGREHMRHRLVCVSPFCRVIVKKAPGFSSAFVRELRCRCAVQDWASRGWRAGRSTRAEAPYPMSQIPSDRRMIHDSGPFCQLMQKFIFIDKFRSREIITS